MPSSEFSWYNSMTVEQIFMSMKYECQQIDNPFVREYVQIGLEKLLRAARLKSEERNHPQLLSVWRAIQPDLKSSGILKRFATPAVKTKIAEFLTR